MHNVATIYSFTIIHNEGTTTTAPGSAVNTRRTFSHFVAVAC
jgi:hypothetical protein